MFLVRRESNPQEGDQFVSTNTLEANNHSPQPAHPSRETSGREDYHSALLLLPGASGNDAPQLLLSISLPQIPAHPISNLHHNFEVGDIRQTAVGFSHGQHTL